MADNTDDDLPTNLTLRDSDRPATRFELWRIALLLRSELVYTQRLAAASMAGDADKITQLKSKMAEVAAKFEDAADELIGIRNKRR